MTNIKRYLKNDSSFKKLFSNIKNKGEQVTP